MAELGIVGGLKQAAWWKPRPIWVTLLFVLLPVQALLASSQLSPTVDEPSHVLSGYAYLVTGRYQVGTDHPPLARVLEALPLVVARHPIPARINELMRDNFLWADQLAVPGVDNIDQLFFWARLPIALLSMLLGWVVYNWAKDLFGPRAGLLALFTLVFDPAILAMSGLATNDLAVTVFIALTLYCVWRLMYSPTRRHLVAAGIAFGLAQLSKFSALVLVPLICLLILLAWLMPVLRQRFGGQRLPAAEPRRSLTWHIKSILGVFVVGLFVIWIGYGFNLGRLYRIALPYADPNDVPLLIRYIPLPAYTYFQGVLSQFQHAERGHPAYLAGQYSRDGWWYYFPVAFILKTPLPTIALIGTGLVVTLRELRMRWISDMYVLIPMVAYIASSMLTGIDIGFRYMLPLLPLLFVMASRVAGVFHRRSWRLAGLIVVCSWMLAESIGIWPNYLAYFNQLAGGPQNGHYWLADSNLDWGQDLHNLKVYMEQRGLQRVKLSYFGTVSPAFYGIQADCLPSRFVQEREGCPSPKESSTVIIEPGVYVISVTNLLGIYLPDHDVFAWFRQRQPTARIGYSLFVYEVPE